jgi:hypothetical protein
MAIYTTYRKIASGRGGYSGGSSSPYEEAYLKLAQRKEDLEEDLRRRSASIAEEREARQESRSQEVSELAKMREVLSLRAAQRADTSEAIRLQKYEREQQALEQADKMALDIMKIDPMHKDAKKNLNLMKNTELYHRLWANRASREVLKDAFSSKTGEIEDIYSGIESTAKSQYGLGGVDRAKLPYKSSGILDTEAIYGKHLPALSQQETAKAEQAVKEYEAPAGYEPDVRKDVYGRPEIKGLRAARVKPADVESEWLKKVKVGSAPLSSAFLGMEPGQTAGKLSVQIGSYDPSGKFVASDKGEGSHVLLVDKSKPKQAPYPMELEKFQEWRERSRMAGPAATKAQSTTSAAQQLGISPVAMAGGFVSAPETAAPSATPEAPAKEGEITEERTPTGIIYRPKAQQSGTTTQRPWQEQIQL